MLGRAIVLTQGPPVYVTNVRWQRFHGDGESGGQSTAGQMALISDCVNRSSSRSSLCPAPAIDRISTGGSPGNLSNAFPGWVSFSPGAQVTPLQTMAYYIGVGTDGDGALYSATVAADNTLTATELAPDIEAMQILYGIDTTGTQTASQYVTADQVPDFTQVMNVEVAVLAAGPPGSAVVPAVANTYNLFGTTVTAPLDTRARQVFEVTIAARNAWP